MPEFENSKTKPQDNSERAERSERKPRKERPTSKRRENVATALNMAGDTTRAAAFNKVLDETFEKKENILEWFKYGHVIDSTEASINYLAVKNDEGQLYVAPVVFESKSGYRRQHEGRESYFTFDLLAQGTELVDLLVEKVAEEHSVPEDDVFVIDAQILPPTFKVDEDSARKVTYNVMTLLDQLSGTAPDDLDIDAFDTYEASYVVNPLQHLPLINTTRSDFQIMVDVSKSRRERWTPSILDNEDHGDLGRSRLHGYADLDYIGPTDDPDTYNGPLESFKPEQYTLKNVITAVEVEGENNIYGRGLLTLAAMAEAHNLESSREVLEERILKPGTDINHLANTLWLPKGVDIPRAKKDEECVDLLDKMVYKRQSVITFLHRDGDMSSGILHLLSKVGQGDDDYLDVLLVELDNLAPVDDKDIDMSVTNRYAKFLGLKSNRELTDQDFVVSYTPRVFGTRQVGDSCVSAEFVDMVQLADITRNDIGLFSEMINATSVVERHHSAGESKEVQIRFFEDINTELDGIGAEYGLNAKFVEFLGKILRDTFRYTEYLKFPDRRDGFRSYHRTTRNNDSRLFMGRRNDNANYRDRGTSHFGKLGRR